MAEKYIADTMAANMVVDQAFPRKNVYPHKSVLDMAYETKAVKTTVD